MADKIYPKGIVCFAKNENAPDFVLGTMVINLKDFYEWCKGEGKDHITEYKGNKQLKLTVLQGRERINTQVDTYKPRTDTPPPPQETEDLF